MSLCRKGYQCFYNFYLFLMLKQDTFSLFTYWCKCILFEIKIIKDYQYTRTLWECAVLSGEHRLYNRENNRLLGGGFATPPFFLCNLSKLTYWCKCILFEIKIIKDYQCSRTLWECGVLSGEHRLYNRENNRLLGGGFAAPPFSCVAFLN